MSAGCGCGLVRLLAPAGMLDGERRGAVANGAAPRRLKGGGGGGGRKGKGNKRNRRQGSYSTRNARTHACATKGAIKCDARASEPRRRAERLAQHGMWRRSDQRDGRLARARARRRSPEMRVASREGQNSRDVGNQRPKRAKRESRGARREGDGREARKRGCRRGRSGRRRKRRNSRTAAPETAESQQQ